MLFGSLSDVGDHSFCLIAMNRECKIGKTIKIEGVFSLIDDTPISSENCRNETRYEKL